MRYGPGRTAVHQLFVDSEAVGHTIFIKHPKQRNQMTRRAELEVELVRVTDHYKKLSLSSQQLSTQTLRKSHRDPCVTFWVMVRPHVPTRSHFVLRLVSGKKKETLKL